MPDPPPVMKIVLPVSFICVFLSCWRLGKPARWAACSPVYRKRVAEHRPAALGLFLSRLVLDDVPMLDEDPIVDPEDVHHDPVRGCPEPRKTPVNDHELLVGNDRSWLVLQR